MADQATPIQERYIDPYMQRIFDYDTTDSRVFISRVTNLLLKSVGNNIVLFGLEPINLRPTISDPPSSIISVDITSGLAIQDYVLCDNLSGVGIEPNITLTMDVAGLDDTTVGGAYLGIWINYQFLESMESNPFILKMYHVNSDGSGVNPAGFDPLKNCTLVAILGFTKIGGVVTDVWSLPAVVDYQHWPTLLVGSTTYYLRGWENSNLNTNEIIRYVCGEEGYVKGPDIVVDGSIALFDGTTGQIIKDSGLTPVFGDVYGPTGSTTGHIAIFDDNTGKLLADGGLVPDGDVIGPSSSVTGNLAIFGDTSGKLISDGGSIPTGDVVGPMGSVAGHLAVFDDVTGKVISDGGPVPVSVGDVVGPVGGADDSHLVLFDGLTGKLIKDGGPVPSGLGDVIGPTGCTPGNLAVFNDATGKILADGGSLPIFGDVVGPASSSDGNLVLFDGISGKLVKDGGAMPIGDVVGPAAATPGNLAVFSDITGKVLVDGGALPVSLGDVVGPGVAISDHIVLFSGTTGKLIKDGGALPAGLGDVVGPATAISGHLAVFSGTTGKLIVDGGAVPSGLTRLIPDQSAGVLPASTVRGTDGLYYRCRVAHSALAANRPITGAALDTITLKPEWKKYWDVDSSLTTAPTWVSGTYYVTNMDSIFDLTTGNTFIHLKKYGATIDPYNTFCSTFYDGSDDIHTKLVVGDINILGTNRSYNYTFIHLGPHSNKDNVEDVYKGDTGLMVWNHPDPTKLEDWFRWYQSGIIVENQNYTTVQYHQNFGLQAWSTEAGQSEVKGTDNNETGYRCILTHVAATNNRPTTGTYWATYWEVGGGCGQNQWVSGTTYQAKGTARGDSYGVYGMAAGYGTEGNYTGVLGDSWYLGGSYAYPKGVYTAPEVNGWNANRMAIGVAGRTRIYQDGWEAHDGTVPVTTGSMYAFYAHAAIGGQYKYSFYGKDQLYIEKTYEAVYPQNSAIYSVYQSNFSASSENSSISGFISNNPSEVFVNDGDRYGNVGGTFTWIRRTLSVFAQTGSYPTSYINAAASASNQYAELPVLSAPMQTGHTYKILVDVASIVSTWTIRSFDGTQTIGTISANGSFRFDWTCLSTNSVIGLDIMREGKGEYGAGGTLSASGGGGSGFTGTYTVSGGNISSVTITNSGSGYTSIPTIVLSGGGSAVITARVSPGGFRIVSGSSSSRAQFSNFSSKEVVTAVSTSVMSGVKGSVTDGVDNSHHMVGVKGSCISIAENYPSLQLQGVYGNTQWSGSTTVLGSDGITVYRCKLSHVSATINRPYSGANWATYWETETTPGTGAVAWVLGRRYVVYGPALVTGIQASTKVYQVDGATANSSYRSCNIAAAFYAEPCIGGSAKYSLVGYDPIKIYDYEGYPAGTQSVSITGKRVAPAAAVVGSVVGTGPGQNAGWIKAVITPGDGPAPGVAVNGWIPYWTTVSPTGP